MSVTARCLLISSLLFTYPCPPPNQVLEGIIESPPPFRIFIFTSAFVAPSGSPFLHFLIIIYGVFYARHYSYYFLSLRYLLNCWMLSKCERNKSQAECSSPLETDYGAAWKSIPPAIIICLLFGAYCAGRRGILYVQSTRRLTCGVQAFLKCRSFSSKFTHEYRCSRAKLVIELFGVLIGLYKTEIKLCYPLCYMPGRHRWLECKLCLVPRVYIP